MLVTASKPTHQVKQDPSDSVPSEYNLFTVPDQQSKPFEVVANVEGNPLTLEVDTGAAVSIISNKSLNSILSLLPTSDTPQTYTRETIPVLGKLSFQMEYHGQNATLPLLVVQNKGSSCTGRNWLAQI